MDRERDLNDLLDDDFDPGSGDYAREMGFDSKPVTVDGVAYPVTTLAKSSAWTKKEPKTYTVVIVDPEGNGTCTCAGYGYRGRCRHLTEARDGKKSKQVDGSE